MSPRLVGEFLVNSFRGSSLDISGCNSQHFEFFNFHALAYSIEVLPGIDGLTSMNVDSLMLMSGSGSGW